MTPPYISAEEAAKRTGLSTSELATLRWNRRQGEDEAIRYTFLTAGTGARPMYDEASVDSFIERVLAEQDAEVLP